MDCNHKLIVIGLMTAVLCLLPATALQIDAPASVQEGELLGVQISGQGLLRILLDGVLVGEGTGIISHSWQTDENDAGSYEYVFNSSLEGNHTMRVAVQDVPFALEMLSPLESEVSSRLVTFSASTNWPADLCWVSIDQKSNMLNAQSDGTHSRTISLDDGIHAIIYKCTRGNETATGQRTFVVDTRPPSIISAGPSGEVRGKYATLEIQSDEISLCRYGGSDVAYDLLPHSMGQTYALMNEITLPLQGGPQTYFVRCADVHGNEMQSSQIISFTGRVAPIASISVDGDEPLAPGRYELFLETNIKLAETPRLGFRYQETGTRQEIGLSGEGDGWRGFLTIPEGGGEILTFDFEGKSIEGVKGTEIEDGVLRVDADPPGQVTDLQAIETEEGVLLEWFMMDREDGLRFNIYRSTSEGVTYADYHASTNRYEFLDKSAFGAKHYFYRIAPVDEAGNLGQLSTEVIASPEAETALDPRLLLRADETRRLILGAMIDANKTSEILQEESNPIKSQIIENMGLVDRSREAWFLLLQHYEKLSPESSTAEIEAALQQAPDVMTRAREMLIQRIDPQSQTSAVQLGDPESLKRNIPYVLSDESRQDALFDAAIELQDKAAISLEAWSFTLWDKTGKSMDRTFVRKRVELQSPRNDITLIEHIPKEVAESIDKLSFSEEPVVLEEDPIVQYKYKVLERAAFEYTIEGIIPLDRVKQTRTLLYPAIPEQNAPAEADSLASITGLSIGEFGFPATDSILVAFGIVIILGLVIYYIAIGESPRQFKGLPDDMVRPAPPARQLGSRQQQPGNLQKSPPRRIVSTPLKSVEPAAQQETVLVEKEPSAEHLIEEAERMIDEKLFEDALSRYKQVLQATQEDADLGRILSERMHKVYRKLRFYELLGKANAAIREKQHSKAKEFLAKAREAAGLIGEEDTLLIREGAEAYSQFMRSLNQLEIEVMQKY